jgi:hypothetical protein
MVTRSFQMVDFETSNSKPEVWKTTSFSKTTELQNELFLTMFYTINLSPKLVIKKGFKTFMIIIILSNYQ